MGSSRCHRFFNVYSLVYRKNPRPGGMTLFASCVLLCSLVERCFSLSLILAGWRAFSSLIATATDSIFLDHDDYFATLLTTYPRLIHIMFTLNPGGGSGSSSSSETGWAAWKAPGKFFGKLASYFVVLRLVHVFWGDRSAPKAIEN